MYKLYRAVRRFFRMHFGVRTTEQVASKRMVT
jgi:hypothetical protein